MRVEELHTGNAVVYELSFGGVATGTADGLVASAAWGLWRWWRRRWLLLLWVGGDGHDQEGEGSDETHVELMTR